MSVDRDKNGASESARAGEAGVRGKWRGLSIRVRYFGLLFLFLVVAIPIAVLGYFAIERAQFRAELEVRHGNDRVADAVAGQVEEYVGAERLLVASAGEAVAQLRDPDARRAVLDSFLIKHQHLKRAAIWSAERELLAGDPNLAAGLDEGLAGRSVLDGEVRQAAGTALGITITVTEPITVAGRGRGAIVAELDLIGLWNPINQVRIGKSGFVRLVTTGGELIAHGDPEERRGVFAPETRVGANLLAGALLGRVTPNRQSVPVIATVAMVPSLDAMILVEQPVSEAFEAVSGMARQLALLAAAVLALALVLGVLFGHQIVGGLERLRRHTQVLGAGDLEARVDVGRETRVKEIRQLADSVNEMAAALHQLQLEAESRERLAAFSRVAAGLAHDLRHPLESIRAALDVYQADPDSEESRDFLDQVARTDVPRMSRFMDDLGRLARTGSLDLELDQRDALDIAREIASGIGGVPKYRGMVTFTASGDSCELVSDIELVKRALYNLAKNGAEACMETGPGGVISISVEDLDGEVRFSVTDNGVGMDEARLQTVLSSDFRSTKRSTGVGLGLGVVKQVAHSHGGTVSVESVVGEGSTFALTLPAGAVARNNSAGIGTGDANEPGQNKSYQDAHSVL